MKLRIIVLGAGFGGLELTTILSESLGENLDLTLIDKNDTFFFGYSKLDVMFGRKAPSEVLLPYSKIVNTGVHFRQELITSIDPANRRVTTDHGTYEADVLVVALGADYDLGGHTGAGDGGNEYYSFAGAERLREVLPTFTKGHAIVGVTSGTIQVSARTERSRVVAARLSDYPRSARGLQDHPGYAVWCPDPSSAGIIQGIAACLC